MLNRTLSSGNLEKFNFEETKKNVNSYFMNLENLEWEWAKLNAQKGLTANYDFSVEFSKQPYMKLGADMFNLSAIDYKEEQLKEYISSYFWAKNNLSDKEQLYIMECFINRKNDDEMVEMLEMNSSDSNEYRQIKRSALYKFADFLNLLAKKQ